jgi:hypothetical protein
VNRSSLPGFVLAFVVLAASVAALLMAGHLVSPRDDDPGASLRPATTSQPLQLPPPDTP